MFKNRLFLAISVVSLLLMSLVLFNPLAVNSPATATDASDFYQRHSDWIWKVNDQNAVIPLTGEQAFPDYFQRHAELTVPSVTGIGASDYFQRHPVLIAPAEASVETTDYYFRHPELSNTSDSHVDLTDYYFRHIHNRSLP